jgi:hypothetical protein
LITAGSAYAEGFPGAPPGRAVVFDVELLSIYDGDDDMTDTTHTTGVNWKLVFIFFLFMAGLTTLLYVQKAAWSRQQRMLFRGGDDGKDDEGFAFVDGDDYGGHRHET